MIKNNVSLSVLVGFIVCFWGCQTKVDPEFVLTKQTALTQNLIGIYGEPSDKPYIEVEYSIIENGRNINKSEWVKLPILIGGNDVIVEYDSIAFFSYPKKTYLYSIRTIKPNYNKNGSHHLIITNHSDKPVEYFIVGTQPIKYEKNVSTGGLVINDGYDIDKFIQTHPIPIYNNAPIYYLLNPDKRPKTDGFIRRVTKWEKNGELLSIKEVALKRIKFTDNNCGNIQYTKPWTIEQVRNLYADEYNQKTNDKVLYMSYSDADLTSNIRLSDLETRYPYLVNKKAILYGKILPKTTLQNNGNIWFINTPYGDNGSIKDDF